jgi:hypothetical protein
MKFTSAMRVTTSGVFTCKCVRQVRIGCCSILVLTSELSGISSRSNEDNRVQSAPPSLSSLSGEVEGSSGGTAPLCSTNTASSSKLNEGARRRVSAVIREGVSAQHADYGGRVEMRSAIRHVGYIYKINKGIIDCSPFWEIFPNKGHSLGRCPDLS